MWVKKKFLNYMWVTRRLFCQMFKCKMKNIKIKIRSESKESGDTFINFESTWNQFLSRGLDLFAFFRFQRSTN